MHLALITAGGAGMFCGSCMHDNTWARALIVEGIEASLIPTYTPLRLDDHSKSLNRVFLGGINVYLNGKLGWWKRVPRLFTFWLDRPGIIRLATRGAVSNNAAELGELTVSMLRGNHGPHRAAIQELASFLARDLKPDAIIFSNALLAGALPDIKRAMSVPVFCTLQGDDVFLSGLTEPYRSQAIQLVSEQAAQFDGFITHTEFYRDFIANYLSLPVEKFHVLPLGIDLPPETEPPKRLPRDKFIIGYFARWAPEKGLHHLIDAGEILQQRLPQMELHVGGYQGAPYGDYARDMLARLDRSGIPYRNMGSPATIREKEAILRGLDVLSVPTEFLEPKGMYVLEAMAQGVPVVQPDHGAFPEMLRKTGGGRLVSPRNPQALATALEELADPVQRGSLAEQAWYGVRTHYDARTMAQRTVELIQPFLR